MTGVSRGDRSWTVLRIIRWTANYLKEKGVASPRLDAEVLLADLLSLDRVQLYLNYDRPLNADELADYRQRVKRRAAREPVAYITGYKEFHSLDFRVGPEVLIPRPETELLVDQAVWLAGNRWSGEETIRVVDLGTGSGAVALALASELDTARIIALDVHGPALEIARQNVASHQLEDRVHLRQGYLLEPLEREEIQYHMIVANLPYVPCSAFPDMEPEVREYEPRISLDGGPDGLDLIRPLVAAASKYLMEDGVLLLETWPDHYGPLAELGPRCGFPAVSVVRDLAGRDRVVVLDKRVET